MVRAFRTACLLLICASLQAGAGSFPVAVEVGATVPAERDHLTLAETMQMLGLPGDGTRLFDAACCKRCKKGKACGDSCIARDKTCHAGVGCACD
jgi:hypothetical protein